MARNNSQPLIQLERAQRNNRTVLVVVLEFPRSDPRSSIPRPPKGNPGIYRITFALCVPGKSSFYESVDLSEIAQSGESLLQMPDGAHAIQVQAGDVTVLFSSNSEGLLSTATMRLQGQSFEDVERYAYNLIMPMLSYWSYLHDVAVDIKGYEVEEEQTQTFKWSFGLIGTIKPLQLHEEFISTEQYRRLFAAYREALNSVNVFYRVLSFYKVTEGVKTMRTRRHRKSGNKGKAPGNPNERIPNSIDTIQGDAWQRDTFLPYLGQEFATALEHLSELIRNAVAHLDPMRDVLDADRFDDVIACERAEPVLAFMARQMLNNELEFAKTDNQPAHKDST